MSRSYDSAVWSSLLSPRRYGHDVVCPEEVGRSHFHKDHDRIIFCSAFRRLGRKTQVHPFALNDHVHTRLTHSMEVGSVGRSLGIRAGELISADLPLWATAHDVGTIVQSACLAHDIGNPPFGHAGEFAIRDWFTRHADDKRMASLTPLEFLDLQSFEGNAQGLRVVTRIENHLHDGGLRLTIPTLGTLLKYPWSVDHMSGSKKFGAFLSEKPILNAIGRDLGMLQSADGKWSRHPLAYLLEAADDICYVILDLEDAIELHILNFDEVKEILLLLCGDLEYDDAIFTSEASARRKISALRGKAMENMVRSVIDVFAAQYEAIMKGVYHGELLLDGDAMVREGVLIAKKIAREKVFPDTRKAELEVGAYSILGTLLTSFSDAVYEQKHPSHGEISYCTQKVLRLMGIHAPSSSDSLYTGYRRMLDYISGMTDNYAAYLARQFAGVGGG